MVFEKLVDILAESRDIDKADVKMESKFADLGLDSLDTVELAMNLEEAFGVTLEMDEGLQTVGDVVRRIEESLQ